MRVGENATRTRTDSAAAGIRAPGAHPAGGRGRPVAAGVTIGALCALGATLSAHAAGPGSLTAPRAAARDVIAAPSPAELTGQIVAVAPNALVIQSLGGPDGRQAGVKQTISTTAGTRYYGAQAASLRTLTVGGMVADQSHARRNRDSGERGDGRHRRPDRLRAAGGWAGWARVGRVAPAVGRRPVVVAHRPAAGRTM